MQTTHFVVFQLANFFLFFFSGKYLIRITCKRWSDFFYSLSLSVCKLRHLNYTAKKKTHFSMLRSKHSFCKRKRKRKAGVVKGLWIHEIDASLQRLTISIIVVSWEYGCTQSPSIRTCSRTTQTP